MKNGETIIEEPGVTSALDKMGKALREKVDKVIDDLAHGRPGHNQHPLTKDRKIERAVDVPDSGKGRGALRIIYEETSGGIILKSITDYH